MPVPNPKNFALTPAAADLGLGDRLTEQLQERELLRRKRAKEGGQSGDLMGLEGASASLLGPYGSV